MATEWRTLTVDQIKSDDERAIAIGPFGSRMKASAYVAAGVPVIRGNNISDTRAFVDEFVFVSEETADQLRSCNVFARDLVFPHRGSIGQVGIIPDDGATRYMLSTSLMKLTCNLKLVDPQFLFYFFRSAAGRHALLEHASTVGTPGIGQPLTSLRSIQVPVPPLPEQRAIAYIVGTLDDKIELNRRMSETLQAMAEALFKSWFVDFDPVRAKAEGHKLDLPDSLADLFPTRLVGSELGEIPEGWEVGCVDDDFELTMGQSPPGETYNESGEGLPFFQGSTDFGFRFPTRRVYCTAPTRLAQRGDTLISVRAPVGDINMASENCAIGRGVAAGRHRTGSRSYSYQFMRSLNEVFTRFEAEGTVFGSIGKKDFHAIACVKPPRDLVISFEQRLEPVDSRIEVNDRESRTLAALRDTLLPKLMSGELLVKDAEKFVGRAV
jgi:type I restriction enzyme, S subunit